MHLANVHIVGITLLVLWVGQVIVMARGPGGLPHAGKAESAVVWIYNTLNMIVLGIVVPAIAVLLATGFTKPIDMTRIPVPDGLALYVVEGCGAVFYLAGHCLVSWARFSIGRSFQMGGMVPRSDDELRVTGAYAIVRHPMYTALFCFNFGLTLLVQSVVVLLLFLTLMVAIVRLIPVEDAQLERAYGEKYTAYRHKVKALIPYVF